MPLLCRVRRHCTMSGRVNASRYVLLTRFPSALKVMSTLELPLLRSCPHPVQVLETLCHEHDHVNNIAMVKWLGWSCSLSCILIIRLGTKVDKSNRPGFDYSKLTAFCIDICVLEKSPPTTVSPRQAEGRVHFEAL